MKTDIIFYELIKELPQIFFELIGKPTTNPNTYEFTAPELKQQAFRLDGLFSPLPGFEEEPLYFVELQTYKDEEFYERLFGEIFLYFRQTRPPQREWYGIVIYDRRTHEILPHPRYENLIEKHIHRFYLNELEINPQESPWLGIAKLLVETPSKTTPLAQKLISEVKQLPDEILRQKVIEFIQAIVVYKFPNLSLEEIQTMLDVSEFKNTRFYQSILKQTKLELVPTLLARGLSIQEVAETLEIQVEDVRQAAK